MNRKCAHCHHNGHNSRTCPDRVVTIFGVRLTDGLIQKSVAVQMSAASDGYASVNFVPGSSPSWLERRKGTPWTEEEHRMFLLGLQKLGKGDWLGIARNYVISRTPTQVACHAQKYFIRQTNALRRKRRSSPFDVFVIRPLAEFEINNPLPSPNLDEDCESVDSS